MTRFEVRLHFPDCQLKFVDAPGTSPRIRHGGIHVTRFVEEDTPQHAYERALSNLSTELDRVLDNPDHQSLHVIVQEVIEEPADLDGDHQPGLVLYYDDSDASPPG